MKEKKDEIKKNSVATKPKPLKKLKPIPQNIPKKTPEPEKSTPKKKRIVIGELPDYESWADSQAEIIPETPDEELQEEKKSEPEKNKKNQKPKNKGFFSRVKDLMYVSADDDEEEQSDEEDESEEPKEEHKKIEISDIPDDDNISFTVEEITENVSDTMDIVSEVLAESKNKTPEPEPPKEPEKKPQQSTKNNNNNNNKNRKKKKNKNKKSGAGNSGQAEKPQNKTEKISEPPEENPVDKPKTEEIKNEPETEKIEHEPEQENIPAEIPEDISEISEDIKNTEKSVDTAVTATNGKYNSLLVLLCVILAIIGVIAIISTCISNIGGSKSSKDFLEKSLYPVVITDISPFENPSELTDNQILSATIWSVILDDEKLSQYPQRIDNMAIIPAEDVENFAKDMFGEDIKELTHSTIVTADSKFYYNEEANSYSVDIKPYTFTYSPEVTSVSKSKGKYIVKVDYIAEHPEWMEDTVSKSAEFTLSKNGSDGYTIDSMREVVAE